MPITNFSGQTFVAFADIAGFKAMMSDGIRGPAALDIFYQSGYHAIGQQASDAARVEGLFVSDCDVLFVRGHEAPARRLEATLTLIESLNRRCLGQAILLTTAIAWGEFSYHERIEISGIEKIPFTATPMWPPTATMRSPARNCIRLSVAF